jgi:hypothetical protein
MYAESRANQAHGLSAWLVLGVLDGHHRIVMARTAAPNLVVK